MLSIMFSPETSSNGEVKTSLLLCFLIFCLLSFLTLNDKIFLMKQSRVGKMISSSSEITVAKTPFHFGVETWSWTTKTPLSCNVFETWEIKWSILLMWCRPSQTKTESYFFCGVGSVNSSALDGFSVRAVNHRRFLMAVFYNRFVDMALPEEKSNCLAKPSRRNSIFTSAKSSTKNLAFRASLRPEERTFGN